MSRWMCLLHVGLYAVALAVGGCENDDEADGGSPGGAETGPLPTGDCDDREDCAGNDCVEITPGGWRTCVAPVVEATSCENPELVEACCSTVDCEQGLCLDSPVVPDCFGIYLRGPNVCATDLCQSDADCVGETIESVCVPRPMLGRQVRACLPATCRTNADCLAEPGGYCALARDECCTRTGLYCVYPSHGCRGLIKDECASGHCALTPEGAHCENGPGPC